MIYLTFSLLIAAVTFRYNGWSVFVLLGMLGLGVPAFWLAHHWLASDRHPRQALRLTIGALLGAASIFSLLAPQELPAAGMITFSVSLMFAGLSDSRAAGWKWLLLISALYFATMLIRHQFAIPEFGERLWLGWALYIVPVIFFILYGLITSDISTHLHYTARTSADLGQDLQHRTLEYQTLLETMNEGFVVINERDEFEYVNEAFSRFLGVSTSQLVGHPYQEVFSLDGISLATLAAQGQQRRQRQRSTYELQARRQDGTIATFLISVKPKLGPDGGYRGASCLLTDITERKSYEEALKAERNRLSERVKERTASLEQANAALAHELAERQQIEQILRETEEEFRQLFSHTSIGLYRADLATNKPLRVNPALVALSGYESEAALIAASASHPMLQYVHPERAAEFQRLLAEQGSIQNFESEIQRADTKTRLWVSENAVLTHDGAGQARFYQGTVEDISARKVVEFQQAQLIAELARVAQLKDEFLASMSHELRTPLNGILGLAELLSEQIYGPLNNRQQRAIVQIEESGQHLLALINDILDLAKLEVGQIELQFTPVELLPICQASIKFIQPTAQKKLIRVYFTLDPQLETIMADKRWLKQILTNLLGNAIKFTPEQGAIGLEVIGKAGDNPQLQFVIWDTGVGISAEDLAKIFRPFVQVDSRLARLHDGTGLGLALVQRMVDLHGGTVTVESQVEQGTRFIVTLPWLQEDHKDGMIDEG